MIYPNKVMVTRAPLGIGYLSSYLKSAGHNIMAFFTEMFDSVGDIEVNVSHIHEDMDGILICEMALSLDKKEFLVADIFEFNQEDQIKALRAYKGN